MSRKFQFICNILILGKKELLSKKEKNQKYYQLTLFNPTTEELDKIFVTKEKFDSFDINNMYQVELLYIVDFEKKNISTYLVG